MGQFFELLYLIPRNLCALDWKESNPHGSTTNFKQYYNNLSMELKKVCICFVLVSWYSGKLQYWKDCEASRVSDPYLNDTILILLIHRRKLVLHMYALSQPDYCYSHVYSKWSISQRHNPNTSCWSTESWYHTRMCSANLNTTISVHSHIQMHCSCAGGTSALWVYVFTDFSNIHLVSNKID